jgi:hypothetical protein
MLNFTFLSFLNTYGVYIILCCFLIVIVFSFINNLKKQKTESLKNSPSNLSKSISQKKGIDINLKMQAYERLTIFLERTDSFRLLAMIDKKEKNLDKIESNIIRTILAEFEYNISQQVYVSDMMWNLILMSKNKNISLISSVKKSLKKNAKGIDFFNSFKLILDNQETTPTKIALDFLKKEVRSI